MCACSGGCHNCCRWSTKPVPGVDQYAEACDEVFRLKRALADAESKAERLYRIRRIGGAA